MFSFKNYHKLHWSSSSKVTLYLIETEIVVFWNNAEFLDHAAIFVIVSFIDAYVKSLSTVSYSCNKRRKYFQVTLQSKDKKIRCLSFSSEKHKLLSKIQNNNTGCELKYADTTK